MRWDLEGADNQMISSLSTIIAGLFGRKVLPITVDHEGHLITIDYEHEKVHSGELFFAKGVLPITASGGTDHYFMFRTGDCQVHARASVTSDIEIEATIFEGATVSADGTPVAAFNANRNSTNTAELTAFAGPTVSALGTQIWQARTGDNRKATGVSIAFGYEIIVKPNTVYLWEITNITNASGKYVDYDFYWYEECHG